MFMAPHTVILYHMYILTKQREVKTNMTTFVKTKDEEMLAFKRKKNKSDHLEQNLQIS